MQAAVGVAVAVEVFVADDVGVNVPVAEGVNVVVAVNVGVNVFVADGVGAVFIGVGVFVVVFVAVAVVPVPVSVESAMPRLLLVALSNAVLIPIEVGLNLALIVQTVEKLTVDPQLFAVIVKLDAFVPVIV